MLWDRVPILALVVCRSRLHGYSSRKVVSMGMLLARSNWACCGEYWFWLFSFAVSWCMGRLEGVNIVAHVQCVGIVDMGRLGDQ